MGYSNKQVIEARIEELLFTLDVLENQDDPKLMILNKLDDLMEMIRDK